MKHLLNTETEIIITSEDSEQYEKGRVYKKGDTILVKRKCCNVKFMQDEYDNNGNPTGNLIQYNVHPNIIRELYKRFDEIENTEPMISVY